VSLDCTCLFPKPGKSTNTKHYHMYQIYNSQQGI